MRCSDRFDTSSSVVCGSVLPISCDVLFRASWTLPAAWNNFPVLKIAITPILGDRY